MAVIEIRVPDLGSFKDVSVIDLLVKPGDVVELETPLATLETEKATMDVPSSAAGTVKALHVSRGGKVNAGDLVATLEAVAAPGAGVAAPAAPAAVAAPPPSVPPPSVPPPAAQPPAAPPPAPAPSPALLSEIPGGREDLAPIHEPGFSRAHASPSVRLLARELGVDLGRVSGSGPKGRITHGDVKAFVKRSLQAGGAPAAAAPAPSGAGLPALPVVDFAAFGAVEVRPLGRIQRISGPRLHASWVNIPHVTQYDEADITELEEARGRLKEAAASRGIKLTPLAFVVRAVVRALAEFPKFASSLDASGQNLVFKNYRNVGFAADTPHGLMVPVIRDADRKDIYETARALADLSEKARAGKLGAADMQGGCFTISSLGGIGGTAFTPIINPPEVAILGVSRSQVRPVWRDGAFAPRLMLPLCLSYDHRVIDGAEGARFITYLSGCLADPRGLLEAVP